MESNIIDLEKRYVEACESYNLEVSEDADVLRRSILSLVKNIPFYVTVASLQANRTVDILFHKFSDTFCGLSCSFSLITPIPFLI